MTLFYEDKEDDKEFQPITNKAIVVFCKLYEPAFNDVAYLGHLLVDMTMPCSELLTCIAGMAGLSNEIEYNVYVEEAPLGIKDITGVRSSLAAVPRLQATLACGTVLVPRA